MSITIEIIEQPKLSEFSAIALYDIQRYNVPSPRDIVKNYIFDRKNGSPPFNIYGIRCEKSIIGLFTLTRTDDGYLWLGGFQLDKRYQGKNIAKRILFAVFKLVFEAKNLAGLKLDVHCDNLIVIRFYQRMGLHLLSLNKQNNCLLWDMGIDKEGIQKQLQLESQ